MKKTIFVAAFFGLALALGGCADKKLEERVSDLEKRVAKLEETNGMRPQVQRQIQSPKPAQAQPQQKPDGPLPTMKFEESSFDFGKITQGDVVTHEFAFKNDGDAPLVISSANASCGCTVPTYTKEPIAPGKSGIIQVKFNSTGKMNQQNKVVRVTANTWPKVNTVTIKAFVNPKSSANGPVKQ